MLISPLAWQLNRGKRGNLCLFWNMDTLAQCLPTFITLMQIFSAMFYHNEIWVQNEKHMFLKMQGASIQLFGGKWLSCLKFILSCKQNWNYFGTKKLMMGTVVWWWPLWLAMASHISKTFWIMAGKVICGMSKFASMVSFSPEGVIFMQQVEKAICRNSSQIPSRTSGLCVVTSEGLCWRVSQHYCPKAVCQKDLSQRNKQ